MSESIPTSEVLYRAADLIETRGWTTADGWFSAPGATTPLCIEGAVRVACERGPASYRAATTALRAYLDYRPYSLTNPGHVAAPFLWNDTECTGGPHAVEVLRACAVIEAAKENADVRESVTIR